MKTSGRLPYPGLRAFERDEADLFFGRDDSVDKMIDQLAATRFLAVLGSSGTGKSSLVNTGLLDGLELGLHPAGADWAFCAFMPGGDPFENLTRALFDVQAAGADDGEVGEAPSAQQLAMLEAMLRQGPRSLIQWCEAGYLPAGRNLLILVDQFEELFRFSAYAEREDAEAFVRLLIESSRSLNAPIHVVITMRSDFLGACSLVPGLAEIINEGSFLTSRMDREACRQAIIGPARMVGMEVEDRLVTRLLNDLMRFAPWEGDDSSDQLRRLARRADQLPMMQHLLNRMYNLARRKDSDGTITLTEADYEALGGINGALDAHGAEILARFPEDQWPLIEAVFRNLVDGNTPISATRRPMRLADLCAATGAAQADVRAVLDVFRGNDCNFLRPGGDIPMLDDTVIDISHESLIRQWSKLSGWVVEEARAANFWRRLATASTRYDQGEGGLLTGLDLANLSSWWKGENPSRHWAARYGGDFDEVAAFLSESEAEAEASQKRRRRRITAVIAGVSAIALVATASALYGFNAQRQAAQANTRSVEVARNLTTDLFTRVDEGLNMPTATLYTLIQDREEAVDDIARSIDSAQEVLDMRADLLIRTIRVLIDAHWVAEASTRAQALQSLAFPEGFDGPSKLPEDVQFDAAIELARTRYEEGRSAQMHAAIEAAQARLEGAGDDLDGQYRRSKLLNLRLAAANSAGDIAQALTLRDALYDLAISAVPAAFNPDLDKKDLSAFWADWETVPVAQQRKAGFILSNYVLAEQKAATFYVGEMALDRLGDADPVAMMEALEGPQAASLALYGSGTAEGNSLKASYLYHEADFYTDEKRVQATAFNKASQAITLRQSALVEDPDNYVNQLELVGDLLLRARIARKQNRPAQFEADHHAARAILAHMRLRRPETWRLFENDIFVSYDGYDNFRALGLNKQAKESAARLNAEATWLLARYPDTEINHLRKGLFSVWSVFDPQMGFAFDRDMVRSFFSGTQKLLSSGTAQSDRSIYMRKQKAFQYDRFLQQSPDLLGDDLWVQLYRDTRENADDLEDNEANSLAYLTVFNSLPASRLKYLSEQDALLVRKTLAELNRPRGKEDPKLDPVAVVQPMIDAIKVPEEPQEAKLAMIRVRQSVFDQFVRKVPSDVDLPAYEAIFNIALEEAKIREELDTLAARRYEFYLGNLSARYDNLKQPQKSAQTYIRTVDSLIPILRRSPKDEVFIGNALLYVWRLIHVAAPAGKLPADLSNIDTLMSDVLMRSAGSPGFEEKRGQLNRIASEIKAHRKEFGPADQARLDKIERMARALRQRHGERYRRPTSVQREDTKAQQDRPVSEFRQLQRSFTQSRFNWTYSPYYPGTWRTLEIEEIQQLLPILVPETETDLVMNVRSVPLPVFGNARLVEYEKRVGGGKGLFAALVVNDNVHRFDGTTKPLYDAVKEHKVRLKSVDDVAAYLRVFWAYAANRDIQFLVAAAAEDLRWQEGVRDDVKKNIAKYIRPMAVWKDDKTGLFNVSVTMQSRSGIFSALMTVTPEGKVEVPQSRRIQSENRFNTLSVKERQRGQIIKPKIVTSVSLDDFTSIETLDQAINLMRLRTRSGEDVPDAVVRNYLHLLNDPLMEQGLAAPDDTLNNLADFLVENGLYLDEALTLVRRAVALDEKDPVIRHTLSQALIKMNDPDAALAELEIVEKAYLGEKDPHRYLAWLYLNKGQALVALKRLDDADAALDLGLKAFADSKTSQGVSQQDFDALKEAIASQRQQAGTAAR